MRKSLYWIFGDAFTKIGGGIFGGIIVAYYVNTFMVDKPFNIYPWYLLILGLGTALLVVGYLAIRESGYFKD
jgi:hypothetical protein